MPKANFPSENQEQLPTEDDSGFGLLGDELTPPPFLFPTVAQVTEPDPSLRDSFITDTAKRELETTQDLFRFLPTADLNALDSIGHPVRDSFLDPLRNCNLHDSNLRLLVELWEKQGPERNLKQLAQLLAIAWHGSSCTFRSLPEEIKPLNWETEEVPAYADSGFWGRGFSALTWEENYFKMGEEIGLDLIQHPSLALLPEIAAAILGTGLFVGGFANTGTLARHFRNDRESRPQQVGKALKETASRFLAHMQPYSSSNLSGLELVELILTMFDSEERSGVWFSDAAILLTALGYSPPLPEPREFDFAKEAYSFENRWIQGGTGDDQSEYWPELARFQADFNRAHPLRIPLNEQGLLDQATFKAISAGGFRLRVGKQMIQFTFDGVLNSSSSLARAFDLHARQEINAQQWARQVYTCMPLESPLQFNQMLLELPAQAARQLTTALVEHAAEPDQMALINRPILEKMKSLLSESSLLSEVEQAISGAFGNQAELSRPEEQLKDFLALEPQVPMRYVVVGKNDDWDSLLLPFKEEGVTREELLELNPGIGESDLPRGAYLILPDRIRQAYWNKLT